MKKDDQRYRTRFLAKYVGLSLYDIDTEKRYSIDKKEIYFVKGEGYALIGNQTFQMALQLIMSIFAFMRIC